MRKRQAPDEERSFPGQNHFKLCCSKKTLVKQGMAPEGENIENQVRARNIQIMGMPYIKDIMELAD